MKTLKTLTLLAVMQIVPAFLFAQSGADLFTQNCAACHSIGNGKLVGPDLKDVQTRHQEAWLMKWIKSSQSLVNAKDKQAMKLFAENSSIPMPDQPLTNDQIKAVLTFIAQGGGVVTADNSDPAPIVAVADKTATDPSAINNNGIDPLVSSGTPAVFTQVSNNATETMPKENILTSNGNAWIVYMSVASMLVLLATIVVFGGVVKDTAA